MLPPVPHQQTTNQQQIQCWSTPTTPRLTVSVVSCPPAAAPPPSATPPPHASTQTDEPDDALVGWLSKVWNGCVCEWVCWLRVRTQQVALVSVGVGGGGGEREAGASNIRTHDTMPNTTPLESQTTNTTTPKHRQTNKSPHTLSSSSCITKSD